jgi:DNA-binding transcriptional MocR family regulator
MAESSTILSLAATLRTHAEQLRPGERLPSTRELVRRHHASPVTVSRAIGRLVAEGVVTTRPGDGTYVARPPEGPRRGGDLSWQTTALGDRLIDAAALRVYLEPVPPGTISMAGGYLHPSLLPVRDMSAALQRASRRPDAWTRPALSGLPALQSWFAAEIGPAVGADEVLVTGGGQSAMSLAIRALVAPGAPLLVESPTYPGALAAARAAGVRPVPVPVDEGGVRPDLLEETFALTRARCVYLQPLFQNPTGTVLDAARHHEVLRVAARAGAFVIEDDFARHLSHDGDAPRPLIVDDDEGRVVYVTSLTKSAAPSMRIGALVARGPVAERVRALHIVDAFFVPRFLQDAAVELVTAPAWHRHLRSLQQLLRQRRQTLVSALAALVPDVRIDHVPRGGMHLWARLPDGVDERRLAEACRQRGVLVSPGQPYFAAEPPSGHLRLSFAGVAGTVDLDDAAQRIADALSVVRERRPS